MEKILIYEDDQTIKEELKTLLKNNGYIPVEELPCDLALLDINMPEKSGFEICREIREKSNVPIIFLTARDKAEDELLGFSVGADDFIKKPYHSSVLLARISRLLKRKTNNHFSKKGLLLDLSNLTVFFEEKKIELTKNEVKILYILMQKDLCTREEIIEELWNNSLYIDDNTLGVNILRLREKLSEIGAGDLIQTVRGVGYRL